MSNIVQYIIVRSDLRSNLGWPLGAVIAQCCHATGKQSAIQRWLLGHNNFQGICHSIHIFNYV